LNCFFGKIYLKVYLEESNSDSCGNDGNEDLGDGGRRARGTRRNSAHVLRSVLDILVATFTGLHGELVHLHIIEPLVDLIANLSETVLAIGSPAEVLTIAVLSAVLAAIRAIDSLLGIIGHTLGLRARRNNNAAGSRLKPLLLTLGTITFNASNHENGGSVLDVAASKDGHVAVVTHGGESLLGNTFSAKHAPVFSHKLIISRKLVVSRAGSERNEVLDGGSRAGDRSSRRGSSRRGSSRRGRGRRSRGRRSRGRRGSTRGGLGRAVSEDESGCKSENNESLEHFCC